MHKRVCHTTSSASERAPLARSSFCRPIKARVKASRRCYWAAMCQRNFQNRGERRTPKSVFLLGTITMSVALHVCLEMQRDEENDIPIRTAHAIRWSSKLAIRASPESCGAAVSPAGEGEGAVRRCWAVNVWIGDEGQRMATERGEQGYMDSRPIREYGGDTWSRRLASRSRRCRP